MELRKILIVEDSELLHKMYDLILMRYRKNGVECVHAFDGRDALNKISKHPDISLIILDINMPVMSGLEFLLHIKRENLIPNVPVIIISTEGKDDDVVRGLQAGATAYLKKPFQGQDLYKIIDKIFPDSKAVKDDISSNLNFNFSKK